MFLKLLYMSNTTGSVNAVVVLISEFSLELDLDPNLVMIIKLGS